MQANKTRLLYDESYLKDVCDRLEEDGEVPKATEIKANVDTTAMIYEIRTALRYWRGGRIKAHRRSDRVWNNCEAIDNGEWRITPNDEIEYNA